MLSIKPGVDLSVLAPQASLLIQVVSSVYGRHGLDCTITDVYRKPSGSKSFHPLGFAVDFRLNDIRSSARVEALVRDVRHALSSNYDVVAHGEGDNFHLHVEYDPKQ